MRITACFTWKPTPGSKVNKQQRQQEHTAHFQSIECNWKQKAPCCSQISNDALPKNDKEHQRHQTINVSFMVWCLWLTAFKLAGFAWKKVRKGTLEYMSLCRIGYERRDFPRESSIYYNSILFYTKKNIQIVTILTIIEIEIILLKSCRCCCYSNCRF